MKEALADLLRDHTHTVRGCFHLGLCVLLHLSVLFDCPSTATSTYGLGPNQFLLFSRSFAERTARKIHRSEMTHYLHIYCIFSSLNGVLTFLKMSTCDLQLGLHGSSITTPAGPATKEKSSILCKHLQATRLRCFKNWRCLPCCCNSSAATQKNDSNTVILLVGTRLYSFLTGIIEASVRSSVLCRGPSVHLLLSTTSQ